MMRTLVKIDLCKSKQTAESGGDWRTRTVEFLDALIETVRSVFPRSDLDYPAGTYYRAEGDAVMLIHDSADEALRAAMLFAHAWWSRTPTMPDCRIIVSTGSVQKSDVAKEITGDLFQHVGIAEKTASPGEILADDATREICDRVSFQFSERVELSVTENRMVGFSRLNYDDPWLAKDAALVHALFVAQPESADARSRAFEVLALEYLREQSNGSGTMEGFSRFLSGKRCPLPDQAALDRVVEDSALIERRDSHRIALVDEATSRMREWESMYQKSRSEAVSALRESIAGETGLNSRVVEERIDLARFIEEYIGAVFVQLRLMASYYDSTKQFFERLSKQSEYDFIIRKHAAPLQLPPDSMQLFRRVFLTGLRLLVSSENRYVAAVFHNVLMSYYLNRPSKYTEAQVSHLREKEYFLDTNTLYAYLVPSSEYHSVVRYAVDRLIRLGAIVRVTDKSVQEYNDSLFHALKRYRADRRTGLTFAEDYPWIWHEYSTNTGRYGMNFETCVSSFTVPSGRHDVDHLDVDRAEKQLATHGIKLHRMERWLDREALGDLYDDVSRAKAKLSRDENGDWFRDTDSYSHEQKVLHDANCLRLLLHPGESPYDARKLFVTCDFKLSRIRRMRSDCSGVMTVSEFAEYMAPYLLLADGIDAPLRRYPNLVLAASLDLELALTKDFAQIVAECIRAGDRPTAVVDTMLRINQRDRMQGISRKLDGAREAQDDVAVADAWSDARDAVTGIVDEARQGLSAAFAGSALSDKDVEIHDLEDRVAKLQRENTQLKTKEAKKARYERKMRRRKENQ